uniref:BHLH domain-containing protein n=1 Tax=Strigamia maritima TaxID=126957 RepID=T1J395_STRMM
MPTSYFITPPLSPEGLHWKYSAGADVADTLLASAEFMDGYDAGKADSLAMSAEFMDDCEDSSVVSSGMSDSLAMSAELMSDYDRSDVMGKNITTNLTDFMLSVEKFVENEMRNKNCLWSGQCAEWEDSQCRHRRRDDLNLAPIAADLFVGQETTTTPFFETNFGDYLIEVNEVHELKTVVSYHPHSDHNYHAIDTPSDSHAIDMRSNSHAIDTRSNSHAIDTPSDSGEDTESDDVDVVGTDSPIRATKRQKTTSSKKSIPHSHFPSTDIAPNCKRTGKSLSFTERPTKRLKTSRKPLSNTNTNILKPSNSPESLKITLKHVPNNTKTTKSWSKNSRFRVKGSRSAFAPGISEDEKNKRLDHNKMERQRRKVSLDYCAALRDVIPFFNSQRQKPKMSKVLVLIEAVKYITHLKRQEDELMQTEAALLKRHNELAASLGNTTKCKVQRKTQSFRTRQTKRRFQSDYE